MTRRKQIWAAAVFIVLTGIAAIGKDESEEFNISSPQWLLTPAPDESSVEKTIAKYIKQKRDVQARVEYYDDNMEDLGVYYTVVMDDVPRVGLGIDTVPTLKRGDKVIIRRIRLVIVYKLPETLKTAEGRGKVLEVNNEIMRQRFTSEKIYLNKSGDLVIENAIALNYNGAPVHCETVDNEVIQMHHCWDEYYKELVARVGAVEAESEQ